MVSIGTHLSRSEMALTHARLGSPEPETSRPSISEHIEQEVNGERVVGWSTPGMIGVFHRNDGLRAARIQASRGHLLPSRADPCPLSSRWGSGGPLWSGGPARGGSAGYSSPWVAETVLSSKACRFGRAR